MESIHSYLSAGSAVLIGAIVASIFTALFNHISTKNENIDQYLGDLAEIEELCRKYWLFEGCTDKDASKLESLGHELRAKLDASTSFEAVSKSILGKKFERYCELDLELFMVATGSSFQTKSFQVAPAVYSEVMQKISEVRALLRLQKNSLFWSR